VVQCRFVVTVAQLVRAPACEVGGRGIVTPQSPQNSAQDGLVNIAYNVTRHDRKRAPLAQSVEQRPFKPLVPGSSPGGRKRTHR
jgi:hypothetical protein